MNVTGFRFLVISAVLFGLLGCRTTKQQTQNVLIPTPEHFKNTATVEDDDLEVTAIISTEKGSKRRRGLLHFVYEDNFLRAFIDKATDEVNYQVYRSIYYEGSDWRFYRQANYEAPDGLKTADTKLLKAPIAHGFDCPGHTSSVCAYNEQSVSLLIEKSWTQSQVCMSRTRVLSGISNLFPDLAKTFMTGFWSQRSLASCRPLIHTRKLREYDFKPLANHLNY